MDINELRAHYASCFNSVSGRAVIADLTRIARATKVSPPSLDPYSAVYRRAQEALIDRILNMLKDRHDRHDTDE